jgi:hypothetical protein
MLGPSRQGGTTRDTPSEVSRVESRRLHLTLRACLGEDGARARRGPTVPPIWSTPSRSTESGSLGRRHLHRKDDTKLRLPADALNSGFPQKTSVPPSQGRKALLRDYLDRDVLAAKLKVPE